MSNDERAPGTKGRILIVDDTPASLLLLKNIVTQCGYVAHPTTSSVSALRFLQSVLPDLILLDVRMPDMDGYDTCARLKSDERTRDIPVIFISAADQVLDKIKAFGAGAVDYIVKPVQAEEVAARIETHLALRNLRKDLEERVRERTAGLLEANKRLQQEIAERQRAEAALRDSQLLLQSTIDNSTAVISVKDPGGRYLLVNRRYEELFHVDRGTIVGKTDHEVFPPEQARRFEEMDRKVLSGKSAIEAEEVVNQDDEPHTYISMRYPLNDTAGKVYAVCSISTDITEHKATDALHVGLNQVLEIIVTGAPLGEVLSNLTRLIESQSRGMMCSVLLLDKDGKHVHHGAAPSLPEAYTRAIDGMEIGPRSGSCGTGMYRRELVVVNDVLNDPLWADYRELAAQHGLRACWSAPIFSHDGELLGSFAMYYGEVRSPSSSERRLIDIAAHIAGIAIERKFAEDRIRYMAHHDMLTGLPNRALLYDRVNQAIAQVQRTEQRQVAVLFIDLDHFKNINDSLGHQVGDRLLKAAAVRLQRCLRKGDSIARLGGDEFVITLPMLADSEDAGQVAQKALEALAVPFFVNGHNLHVTASIGISLYPTDGIDAEALMRTADTAMYHAKEKGRGNFQFFTPALNAAVQRRLSMENQLRQALPRGELVLYYQPQVDMESGRITGAEALLRWRRPGGDVSCGDFIRIAEETGLIVPIGEWALRHACKQLQHWRTNGHVDLRIAVNLSARQFFHVRFEEIVMRILDEVGLPPEGLDLEITEGLLMQPNEDNFRTLQRLSAMGVQLSLDDFGIGYSSMSYLHRFPINSLKIDQSFVNGVVDDPSNAAIVTAIITMAQSLRLRVVAEGVETEQQVAFLKARGCPFAQGYYYGRPVLATKFAEELRRQNVAA